MKEKNKKKIKYWICLVLSLGLLIKEVIDVFFAGHGKDYTHLYAIVFTMFLAYRCVIELLSENSAKRIYLSKIYILAEIIVYVMLVRRFDACSDYLQDTAHVAIDLALNCLVIILAIREISKVKRIEE